MTDEEAVNQELKIQWLNSLVQLAKFGQEKNFLDKDGQFSVCLSSETEKISIDIGIEATNIVAFPKKETKK